MASSIALLVLDDPAMRAIEERGECPRLFHAAITLLDQTLTNLLAYDDAATAARVAAEAQAAGFEASGAPAPQVWMTGCTSHGQASAPVTCRC